MTDKNRNTALPEDDGGLGFYQLLQRWRRAAIFLELAVLALLVIYGRIGGDSALLIGLASIPGWIVLWRPDNWHKAESRQRPTATSGQASAPAIPATRLDMVLSRFPEPLVVIDRDWHVTFCSPLARQLLSSDLDGRDLRLFLRHPDIQAAITASLKGQSPDPLEITLRSPAARQFVVLVVPLPDVSLATLVSFHEITDIRRGEQMRAEFVANASHELRTPLASLVGFIETLKDVAKDDEAARKRFLDVMEVEANRMTRLIDDLLSLSRIERDEHLAPTDRVKLAPLVRAALGALDLRAQEHRMRLIAELPDDLPDIVADADQVSQVLQNLISNALKYGREDTEILIKAARVARLPESGLPGVALSVTDQGEGIAPEHIPRLTDRFYRADKARSRQLGSTGLGLAIVKHIMRRHRGNLDISSTLGQGTTVKVSFPQAR